MSSFRQGIHSSRVKYKLLLLLIFSTFMTGCDPILEPPMITNEFDTNIEISVNFEDGTANQIVLPPCKIFDSAEFDLASKSSVEVNNVVVRKAGVVIHHIDEQQLASFIDKQKSNTDSAVWSIGSNGIRLVPNVATACAEGLIQDDVKSQND